MEAVLVPCGFAILYLWRNRNHIDPRVADTVVQTMVFCSVVASIPWRGVAWCLVAPPLVLFLFFVVYQHLRAARTEPLSVRVGM